MLKEIIEKELNKALKNFGYRNVNFSIEKPSLEQFGDYASNVCFVLAKKEKKSPTEISKKFIDFFANSKIFEKVEVANNGFLNFFIKKNAVEKYFLEFNPKKIKAERKFANMKANIEFISANPTGLLHIGNGRSAFFGDVLGNVFKKLGAKKVVKEYYINDAKTSRQIKEFGKTAVGEGNSYLTDYLKKKISENKKKIEAIKRKFSDDKENLYTEAGYFLAKQVMKDIKRFIEKDLKVRFDVWQSENEFFEKSYIKKTFEYLKKKGLTYKKDGAWWIKTKKFGDSQDWVLIRKTGEPSYLLSDIAYHKYFKFSKFNKVITLLGADHQGHKKRMQVIAKMLGFKGEFDILITQIVTLKEGKMSKRAGRIVYLKDLINEVGLDSARFFYLQKSLDTQMMFDMALAKEKSKKSPVYYCQYAFVRCNSILRKHKGRLDFRGEEFSLSQKEELDLAKAVLRFEEVLRSVGRSLQVHQLVGYAIFLADKFHNFYHVCRVLSEKDKNKKASRLYLVEKTASAFEEIFNILGISKPLRM